MKKTFDAVKMVRDIRDKLHRQTKRMTPKQVIEFYRGESARFRMELGNGKKLIKAH